MLIYMDFLFKNIAFVMIVCYNAKNEVMLCSL